MSVLCFPVRKALTGHGGALRSSFGAARGREKKNPKVYKLTFRHVEPDMLRCGGF